MFKLGDRNWKPFSIKDIFVTETNGKKLQVPTGAYIHRDNLACGNTPRITVTSLNNGIDSFCKSKHNNYRTFKNFISVSFLGTIFYHPYSASIDMKVHCLQLKDKSLNRYLSEFLITEIRNAIVNASYGNQLSSTDLPHIKIILPVDKKGDPDYDFMEQFIKEREEKKRNEYIEYAKRKISEIELTIRETNGGG